MTSGPSSPPTSRSSPRPRPSASTTSDARSTRSATSSARAAPGATYRTTSRPGPPSSSRRSAGSKPAPSTRWPHDLRALLRVLAGRGIEPTASVLDSRTLRSTPESGHRAGYDGGKRSKGSKVHMAVDTLGHLLALVVTPGKEQDRDQVGRLSAAVQRATGQNVTLAYVDQGYTGARPRRRRSARDQTRGRQAHRGQARLRAAASALGGRALLRVARALPKARAGLRTAAGDAGEPAFLGVCGAVATSVGKSGCAGSMTSSRASGAGSLAPAGRQARSASASMATRPSYRMRPPALLRRREVSHRCAHSRDGDVGAPAPPHSNLCPLGRPWPLGARRGSESRGAARAETQPSRRRYHPPPTPQPHEPLPSP